MVTLKLEETTFPQPSMTVYVTVVVPNSKTVPLAMFEVKDATLQSSLASGSIHSTKRVQVPDSVRRSMSAGIPLITGSTVSTTMTSRLMEETLPLVSVRV